MSVQDALDIFFEMLKECVESITLPTGDSQVPTFLYATGIFIVSLLCRLFGIVSLINWAGALIAVLLLFGLLLVDRRGKDEVSRLYRVVKSGAATLKKRAKGSGAAVKTNRGAGARGKVPPAAGRTVTRGGKVHRHPNGNKRGARKPGGSVSPAGNAR